MKNLFNDMSKSEKQRILEMHVKNGYSPIVEQTSAIDDRLPPQFRGGKDRVRIPGMDDDAEPANYSIKIPKSITIDGSLFKNGISNIDKNNNQYKSAINTLKKMKSSDDNVTITGGASKVGSKQGFDNKKLAQLRANNFITAAKQDGVTVNMITSTEVGQSEVKNSPAAEKEQFIKIGYTEGGGFKGTTAIDKTRVDKKLGGNFIDDEEIERIKKTKKLFKMCLKNLTGTEYMELHNKFEKIGKISSRSIQS